MCCSFAIQLVRSVTKEHRMLKTPLGFYCSDIMRISNKKQRLLVSTQHWTQQQDIFLIEHNEWPITELQQHLPYSEEEIMARRKILGLVTRIKQLKRLTDF